MKRVLGLKLLGIGIVSALRSHLLMAGSRGGTSVHLLCAASVDAAPTDQERNSGLRMPVPAAVYYHEACEGHDIPAHPECADRVRVILQKLRQPNAFSDDDANQTPSSSSPSSRFRLAPRVKNDDALLFHTLHHLKFINGISHAAETAYNQSGGNPYTSIRTIDEDTQVMWKSREAIYRAAGAVTQAVDDVYLPSTDANKIISAFACVRPPGHHAEPDRAMGFCYFNNVGIAAKYAQKKYGVKRVAVLDFDVHHGKYTPCCCKVIRKSL
jgi:acetoin utilization deacetylase AcuC-like enzyme